MYRVANGLELLASSERISLSSSTIRSVWRFLLYSRHGTLFTVASPILRRAAHPSCRSAPGAAPFLSFSGEF